MQSPRATIIIPCYNGGDFLVHALEKARAQDEKDLEIIVVNDGSTDLKTISLFRTLETQHTKNLRILHRASNRGLSAARNYGVQYAQSSRILFWDVDDAFDPSFLRKGLLFLEKHPAVAAVGSYVRMHVGSRERLWRPRGGSASSFLFRTECAASALVRKEAWEAVGGYDEDMKHGMEDWDFWLALTQAYGPVHILKEPLFHYQVRLDSMVRTITKRYEQEILQTIYQKYKPLYAQYGRQALVQTLLRMLINPGYVAYPAPMLRVLYRNMRGHFFYRIFIPCMELIRYLLYPIVWMRDGWKFFLRHASL